jgi:outer membrane protein assembly factor BamB
MKDRSIHLSPIVSDGSVYAVTPEGAVFEFDVDSLEKIGTDNLIEVDAAAPPTIAGGDLIVLDENGRIQRFNINGGTLAGDGPRRVVGTKLSNPLSLPMAVDERNRVYAADESKIVQVNQDEMRDVFSPEGNIKSAPVVDGNHLLALSEQSNGNFFTLTSWRCNQGSQEWSKQQPGRLRNCSLTIREGDVVFSAKSTGNTRDKIYYFDRQDGGKKEDKIDERWNISSEPVVYTQNECVVFGTREGHLRARFGIETQKTGSVPVSSDKSKIKHHSKNAVVTSPRGEREQLYSVEWPSKGRFK